MKPPFRERMTAAEQTWREKVISREAPFASIVISVAMLLAAFIAS